MVIAIQCKRRLNLHRQRAVVGQASYRLRSMSYDHIESRKVKVWGAQYWISSRRKVPHQCDLQPLGVDPVDDLHVPGQQLAEH